MARKKAPNQTELLTKLIGVRLSAEVYDRLEKFRQESDCQTVAELARRILSKDKIVSYYRDTSMDAHMEILAGIEKELNAIGININQITRAFHSTDMPSQKMLHSLKVEEQYRKVGEKVEKLLTVVSQLSRKWLQK